VRRSDQSIWYYFGCLRCIESGHLSGAALEPELESGAAGDVEDASDCIAGESSPEAVLDMVDEDDPEHRVVFPHGVAEAKVCEASCEVNPEGKLDVDSIELPLGAIILCADAASDE
jgi:hypothetical protein